MAWSPCRGNKTCCDIVIFSYFRCLPNVLQLYDGVVRFPANDSTTILKVFNWHECYVGTWPPEFDIKKDCEWIADMVSIFRRPSFPGFYRNVVLVLAFVGYDLYYLIWNYFWCLIMMQTFELPRNRSPFQLMESKCVSYPSQGAINVKFDDVEINSINFRPDFYCLVLSQAVG